jgi:hypothetical protein
VPQALSLKRRVSLTHAAGPCRRGPRALEARLDGSFGQ